MDDGMDDQMDSGEASFLIPTSFTIYDDVPHVLLFSCCYHNGELQFVSWDEPKGSSLGLCVLMCS
jgi:hypothetical protein